MGRVSSWRDDGTVSFAARLAGSEAFKALFREGMHLVEETAAYLDGEGRDESKALARGAALAYAAESMRLTTRLMQLASWLLLQRAVNEGEMSQSDAATEKRKVRLTRQDVASRPEVLSTLPMRLIDLVQKSMRLQERILHLDEILYPRDGRSARAVLPGAVRSQLEQLQAAFPTR